MTTCRTHVYTVADRVYKFSGNPPIGRAPDAWATLVQELRKEAGKCGVPVERFLECALHEGLIFKRSKGAEYYDRYRGCAVYRHAKGITNEQPNNQN